MKSLLRKLSIFYAVALKLSVAQLEDLAEAIFDLQTSADLSAWIKKQLAR
ncbi:MAG: DUF4351 domain-containing protein [Pseudanabaena sp.]